MLRQAPKFYEVAKRIIEITEDCIIVAHNAKFDYRILKLEFSRLGYNFECKNLCTVELSKQLIPDLPSYSLGKLVRSLGIPIRFVSRRLLAFMSWKSPTAYTPAGSSNK